MFCSQCGNAASGKVLLEVGAALAKPPASETLRANVRDANDWENEVCYDV
jgi:hypothetical protein